MKQIFIALFSLVFATTNAQNSNYEKKMTENMRIADTTTSAALLAKSSAIFSALYETDPKWEVLYYETFALIRLGKYDPNDDKKEISLKKAEELLAGLPTSNAEVLVLKALEARTVLSLHHELFLQYLPLIIQSLDSAQTLDPENPRVYLLKGSLQYYMPENMGGGKEKGLALIRLSLEKYNHAIPANKYSPDWGRSEAVKMLAAGN
jgi:hypothetical protein